jgi:hypothetical protein
MPFNSCLTDKLHEIYQWNWELCCTRWADESVTSILWNPKVHCRNQNNPLFFYPKPDKSSQRPPTLFIPAHLSLGLPTGVSLPCFLTNPFSAWIPRVLPSFLNFYYLNNACWKSSFWYSFSILHWRPPPRHRYHPQLYILELPCHTCMFFPQCQRPNFRPTQSRKNKTYPILDSTMEDKYYDNTAASVLLTNTTINLKCIKAQMHVGFNGNYPPLCDDFQHNVGLHLFSQASRKDLQYAHKIQHSNVSNATEVRHSVSLRSSVLSKLFFLCSFSIPSPSLMLYVSL